MVNRPKQQGTRYETATVNAAHNHGHQAERIPEQGQNDQGDIRILLPDGTQIIAECKHRTNLNPHQTLHKATRKAHPHPAILFHKKLTRKNGNQKRTPTGLTETVTLTTEHFWQLLTAAHPPQT